LLNKEEMINANIVFGSNSIFLEVTGQTIPSSYNLYRINVSVWFSD